ncbi:ferritin-like domain-containing protein [Aciditerrimonas ferrireducens]|uniref:ferritin-like domain-containing protein n=1 Tax=Aciditerrimonas ferrireducens TaxID=667306 RepID=UPI00200573F2|nr:ferritin-like domain-containing protein [Aciditerrimonas ferrireducens]MCK4178091.1 ferritin-like domain-containing protein [Aciditerrimonas ferrireducens]
MIRRRKTTTEVFEGTEAELARMTKDLHEIHYDLSLPAMQEAVADLQETNQDRLRDAGLGGRTSRRTFLLGTGAVAAGGLLLAACSSSSSSSSKKSSSASSSASGKYPADLTGDLKVAALAASLENLAVYAYTAGINAAKAGKLGTVPPAVVTFAVTARSQHQQHGAAWNSVLTGAGKPKVTETDPALTPTVNSDFAKVTDVTGLANLALTLENVAAQTYQAAIAALSSTKAIGVAATIQPVELQHAAILNFVLGNYPVPNAFNPTSEARPTSDLNA